MQFNVGAQLISKAVIPGSTSPVLPRSLDDVVYVYTTRKNVKICTEMDVCSAYPVMEDFEISVRELLAK